MNSLMQTCDLLRYTGTLIIAVLFLCAASQRLPASDDSQNLFEQRIRPLLLEKCIECHGPTKQENGVRLDRRDDVLHGKAGDSLLINAATPDESRLLKVLHYVEGDTHTTPTKVQTFAILLSVEKKGEVDSIDNSDLIRFNFNVIDSGAKDFTARVPVSCVKSTFDLRRE